MCILLPRTTLASSAPQHRNPYHLALTKRNYPPGFIAYNPKAIVMATDGNTHSIAPVCTQYASIHLLQSLALLYTSTRPYHMPNETFGAHALRVYSPYPAARPSCPIPGLPFTPPFVPRVRNHWLAAPKTPKPDSFRIKIRPGMLLPCTHRVVHGVVHGMNRNEFLVSLASIPRSHSMSIQFAVWHTLITFPTLQVRLVSIGLWTDAERHRPPYTRATEKRKTRK